MQDAMPKAADAGFRSQIQYVRKSIWELCCLRSGNRQIGHSDSWNEELAHKLAMCIYCLELVF